MNFLQICQHVGAESNTVASGQPLTAAAQTGRLAKVVSWSSQAWVNIQNRRTDWLWMRAEFTSALVIGDGRYAPIDFGITRLARWWPDGSFYHPMTVYSTALGVTDESPLTQVSWETYRYRYGRGAQSNGRPSVFAVAPDKRFCVGPAPDGPYVINGEYQKSAQVILDDADVPEMPEQFHMAVVWAAVMLLHEHDEGAGSVASARDNLDTLMRDLENDQLPSVTVSGARIA